MLEVPETTIPIDDKAELRLRRVKEGRKEFCDIRIYAKQEDGKTESTENGISIPFDKLLKLHKKSQGFVKKSAYMSKKAKDIGDTKVIKRIVEMSKQNEQEAYKEIASIQEKINTATQLVLNAYVLGNPKPDNALLKKLNVI